VNIFTVYNTDLKLILLSADIFGGLPFALDVWCRSKS